MERKKDCILKGKRTLTMADELRKIIIEAIERTSGTRIGNGIIADQSTTKIKSLLKSKLPEKKIPYCIEDKGAVRDCLIFNQTLTEIEKIMEEL